MFGIDLIWLGLTGAAGVVGYVKTRQFVRKKLRFVDAVEKPATPLIAGTVAALVASPLMAILPIVTATSGVLFGLGVGAGVLHGGKDHKRLPGA
jgi:hypothetical protein